MLIDIHTHAFPDALAPRVMETLSRQGGGLEPQTDGTAEGLLQQMGRDGVDLAVVQCIATTPRQQKKVNDFAIELNGRKKLMAFGSVHPDAPDAPEELERLKAAGLKGIKLHPEYQGFYADDPKMKPIYEKISRLGLTVLFHAGNDLGFLPPYHGMPDRIVNALKWLDTPVIAAHWGGLSSMPEMADKVCGIDGLYMDISFGYSSIARPVAQKIVEKHGTHRLLFGSDMPWHRPSWELRLLGSLELSQEETEAIRWKNAAKLLGL